MRDYAPAAVFVYVMEMNNGRDVDEIRTRLYSAASGGQRA